MNIQVEVLTKLPKALHPEYTKLLEAGEHERANQLLEQHIPNIDAFVSSVATATIKEFKALGATA